MAVSSQDATSHLPKLTVLALTWLLLFFGLPETLKARPIIEETSDPEPISRPALSRTTTRESVRRKSRSYVRILRIIFWDPLKIFVYLRYPAVVLTIYYASVTFGTLYVLNISITYTFERPPYNFTTLIIGLLYLPNSLGYILASVVGGRWMDYIMKREAVRANRVREGKLVYRPEDRMRENAWLGAFMYPAALIWYGWTADYGVHWIAPVSRASGDGIFPELALTNARRWWPISSTAWAQCSFSQWARQC
jgi:hypothetical protein